jgi:hypothetical protein
VMRDVTAVFQIVDKLWSDTRSKQTAGAQWAFEFLILLYALSCLALLCLTALRECDDRRMDYLGYHYNALQSQMTPRCSALLSREVYDMGCKG